MPIASACVEVRQLSVFGPLQTRVLGSKRQACGLKIMPSATPSSASQVFNNESTTSFLSPPDSALPAITLPLASRAAAFDSATETERRPRFEYPVRIAGAPETMPSK